MASCALGLSKKIEFRIFIEFKIKMHIRMPNVAFEFEVSVRLPYQWHTGDAMKM